MLDHGLVFRLIAVASALRRRRFRKVRGVALQVAVLCLVKVGVHAAGLETLSISPLFSAIVASTVFLLGFLLSGVLTDYKESEKIPAELATALETLTLELRAIPLYRPQAHVQPALQGVAVLGQQVHAWLLDRVGLEDLLQRYWQVHAEVVAASAQFTGDASTLRGRLMQCLEIVLQRVNRVQTIRDTTFVPLVYWMAHSAAVLLIAGLVLATSQNLVESVFFLAVIAFLVILLLRLIDDIDNPFGAASADSAEDVSLEILQRTVERLEAALTSL